MLTQTSLNYEHFAFFHEFSQEVHHAHINQIWIIYALPQKCFSFRLDWMCLGWMWGFPKWLHFLVGNKRGGLTCVPKPSWGNDAGQQLCAGRPGWRSWAGSEGRGCSPPTGAMRPTAVAQRSSVLGKGGDSVFPLQGCLILWAPGVALCWLLGTRAADMLAQVTLQGLVNLKEIKNANSEVTQIPQ